MQTPLVVVKKRFRYSRNVSWEMRKKLQLLMKHWDTGTETFDLRMNKDNSRRLVGESQLLAVLLACIQGNE